MGVGPQGGGLGTLVGIICIISGFFFSGPVGFIVGAIFIFSDIMGLGDNSSDRDNYR